MKNNRINEILKELEEKSNASTLKRYEKNNEPKPFFGVTMGDITKLSKKFKNESELFIELFKTNNLDAQVLATYIGVANDINKNDLLSIINDDLSIIVIDKLTDKILTLRADKNDLRDEFYKSDKAKIRRIAWNIEVNNIHNKEYSTEEIEKLLKRIEDELATAPEDEKWAMNHAFVEIALSYGNYLDHVLESSKKIGAYEDMKVSKGCTSAFAPSWINAILKKR